jgi:hypothetical protein
MRTLTYNGRAGRRRFGKDDGMSTDLEFARGVPLEVSDANAEALLDGPHGDEFTEGAAEGTLAPPDDDTPSAAEADEKEA